MFKKKLLFAFLKVIGRKSTTPPKNLKMRAMIMVRFGPCQVRHFCLLLRLQKDMALQSRFPQLVSYITVFYFTNFILETEVKWVKYSCCMIWVLECLAKNKSDNKYSLCCEKCLFSGVNIFSYRENLFLFFFFLVKYNRGVLLYSTPNANCFQSWTQGAKFRSPLFPNHL